MNARRILSRDYCSDVSTSANKKFAEQATEKLARLRCDRILKICFEYDEGWEIFVFRIYHNTGKFFKPRWNLIETKKCVLSDTEREDQKGRYIAATHTDFLVDYFAKKQV